MDIKRKTKKRHGEEDQITSHERTTEEQQMELKNQ